MKKKILALVLAIMMFVQLFAVQSVSAESGHIATFEMAEHFSIVTYDTKDYSTEGIPCNGTAIAKNSDTGVANMDGDDQVNFKVILDEGYVVDTITVTPTDNYKNLKGSDDTGVENLYRITKIKGDITVVVTVKPESTEPVETVAVKINEVCSSNSSILQTAGGEYCDWIELKNFSDEDIDLSGYGVSDSETNLLSSVLPQGTVIPANGLLLVWCDKSATFASDELFARFGISADGETIYLSTPDRTVVDSLTFPALTADVTYGLSSENNTDCFKMIPSPLAENNGELVEDLTEPVFSAESGFYKEEFDLEITCPSGYDIYYTTDGSTPTVNSTKYTGAIKVYDCSVNENVYSAYTNIAPGTVTPPDHLVDKTMVIRAVAINQDGEESAVVTKNYFVGYDNKDAVYSEMPIVTITTDPDNLFSEDKGIYVLGDTYKNWLNGEDYDPSLPSYRRPANYANSGKSWEREVSLDIYENGELAHSQNVGIRIQGNASRSKRQKNFNVYARSDYGKETFDYKVLPNKEATSYTRFALHAGGGQDAESSQCISAMLEEMSSSPNVSKRTGRPVLVFLDGEFWGLYTLREKLDSTFHEDEFGVNPDDLIQIKSNEIEEGETADWTLYSNLIKLIKNSDLSDENNYKKLCETIDVDSFIDYYCYEIYIGNYDWPTNNFSLWRTRTIDESKPYYDGKWRWTLYDLDYSSGQSSQCLYNFDSLAAALEKDYYLKSMLKNDIIKQKFLDRLCYIMNYDFNPDRLNDFIEKYTDLYKEGVALGTKRYALNKNRFDSRMKSFKTFFEKRNDFILNSFIQHLGLNDTFNTVTIKGSQINKDYLSVDSTPIYSNNDWKGYYFTSNPPVLTYKENDVYTFKGFSLKEGSSPEELVTESSVSLDFDNGNVEVAVNYVLNTESISLASLPEKLTYIEGEDFDETGLAVEVNFADGTKETTTDYTISGYNKDQVGKQTLEVSYTDTLGNVHTQTIEVEVVKKLGALVGVKIVDKPAKTTYMLNEAFDSIGMSVVAVYEHGEVEITDYTISGYDLSALGNQEVIVTYEGFTDKFSITVNDPKTTVVDIMIKTLPSKINYVVGEQIDTKGLEVIVFYGDGAITTLSNGFNVLYDFAKTGKATVTVSLGNHTAEFFVVVLTEKINLCKHSGVTRNAKAATYFAEGYSGDNVCDDCGEVLDKGVVLPKLKLKTPKAKVTAAKKAVTIKITNKADANKLQVRYKLKGAKKYKTKTFATTKALKKIAKLKTGKQYVISIRGVKTSGALKCYSAWSKAKTYKVK